MPREVEECVVGEVQDGIPVADGAVGDLQLVLGGEPVGHRCVQRAGISLLPVRADIAELHAALRFTRLPELRVEAAEAPVQGVGAVVGGERAGFAVQGKARAPQPVGVAPAGGAEIFPPLEVVRGAVEAEHDVPDGPVPSGDAAGDQARAEVAERNRGAGIVGKGVERGPASIRQQAEVRFYHLAHTGPPQRSRAESSSAQGSTTSARTPSRYLQASMRTWPYFP